MASPATSGEQVAERILQTVRQFWGFDTLRPLQEQAIRAGLELRDSLVVMPTGGGKSLCYQVPPAIAERTDIVVSPLISLMKDQVDGLVSNGYPAAALHSNLAPEQHREIERGILGNKYRLLFVAPERLLTPWFLAQIERLNVKAFAIDEAHCISQWGHDFRPEYRQLRTLKDRFPAASLHAYTATATPRVRQDIVEQLGLINPNILVGGFDRPNLIFRIVPKTDVQTQVLEVIRRHAGEAAIVYCLSRKDTEAMADVLKANGVKAAAYHAGMEKEQRSQVQEAFAEETLDVVVATVAFGMGIDRSNVRCVIHASMPKSVEHYQQEAGRAGRDGLEAECIMFYSVADVIRWDGLIEFSAEKIEDESLRMMTIAAGKELLSHMQRLCSSSLCRHRALSRYFGQDYLKPSCGACDVCLSEVDPMPESTVVAQKILSCVARLRERFGVGHVIDVLSGSNTEQVRSFGHQSLTTYGLLPDISEHALRSLIYQLVDLGLLERTPGDRPTLHLNDAAWEVLRGRREVQLVKPASAGVKKTKLEEASWENVDRALFDRLRELRRTLASERGVPAFVIFGDAVLRELAAVRPSSLDSFRRIHGVGQVKAADLGESFTSAIAAYCAESGVSSDNFNLATMVRPEKKVKQLNGPKDQAMRMFAEGRSVDETVAATGRARSTVGQYLEEWIRTTRPASVDVWVNPEIYQQVRQAAVGMEGRAMRPIFEKLNGQVPYEEIRAVVAHIEASASK